jgi:hypothetical protein
VWAGQGRDGRQDDGAEPADSDGEAPAPGPPRGSLRTRTEDWRLVSGQSGAASPHGESREPARHANTPRHRPFRFRHGHRRRPLTEACPIMIGPQARRRPRQNTGITSPQAAPRDRDVQALTLSLSLTEPESTCHGVHGASESRYSGSRHGTSLSGSRPAGGPAPGSPRLPAGTKCLRLILQQPSLPTTHYTGYDDHPSWYTAAGPAPALNGPDHGRFRGICPSQKHPTENAGKAQADASSDERRKRFGAPG